MPLEQTEDHVVEAVRNMLQQFRGKRAFEGLVSAIVRPFNTLETDGFALLLQRMDISVAVGAQLDGIGSIVGLTRGGRVDADYRTALRAEIASHASHGRVDDLIDVCDGQVAIREFAVPFAEFDAESRDPDDDSRLVVLTDARAAEIVRLLNRARSGGVYFTFRWRASATTGFAFDGAGSAKFDGGSVFAIGALAATENS